MVRCLNPFFVRSSFQTIPTRSIIGCILSLNPFFVRSSFQTNYIWHQRRLMRVLIPSSSGLHFKLRIAGGFLSALAVLIPSSSGLHFKQRKPLLKAARMHVLIPSSSGLHFKPPSCVRAWVASWRLNPFFVRSSFQTPLREKFFVYNGLQGGLQEIFRDARGT